MKKNGGYGMKRVWVCQWEIAKGDGFHAKEYKSFPKAVMDMRKKIAESIDLEEYIADLDPDDANYLRSYLTDPEFPRSPDDVPEDHALPEYGFLDLYASSIEWSYPYDAYPVLRTNLVLNPDRDETCFFDFHYNYPEEATGHGCEGMNIKIIPCINFGNSAHPLMVWLSLGDTPQNQDQLSQRILNVYGTAIERKAIGRHLKLLKTLGFPVQHSREGYYTSGAFSTPESGTKYGTSAYPLMIYRVLDSTPRPQAAIAQTVYAQFGVKMERKAVGRHLHLLEALWVNIQKNNAGYFIGK